MNLGSFAGPGAEFSVLVALAAVLGLRAWAGVTGRIAARHLGRLMNIVIGVLLAAFIFFVYVRFATLA